MPRAAQAMFRQSLLVTASPWRPGRAESGRGRTRAAKSAHGSLRARGGRSRGGRFARGGDASEAAMARRDRRGRAARPVVARARIRRDLAPGRSSGRTTWRLRLGRRTHRRTAAARRPRARGVLVDRLRPLAASASMRDAGSTPQSSASSGRWTASCRSSAPVPHPTSSTRSGSDMTASAMSATRCATSRCHSPSRPSSYESARRSKAATSRSRVKARPRSGRGRADGRARGAGTSGRGR